MLVGEQKTREEVVRDIHDKMPISLIAGRYTRLTKRGAEHVGLCPLHGEKTESFTVQDSKGMYYCFGCKQGGDVLNLVQKVEGLTFDEAVERLADELGIKYTRQKRQPGMIEALEAAHLHHLEEFYSSFEAQQFAESRGITSRIAAEYGIGFAPKGDSGLLSELRRKDVPEAAARKVGVLNEYGKPFLSAHTDRLVIPIHDHMGKLVAFTGRRLDGEKDRKYLNTPESPLFHKKRLVFGLWAVRDIIKKKKYAILSEGPLDAFKWQVAGEPGTAVLGSGVNQEHISALRRAGAETIYLSVDRDKSGFVQSLKTLMLLRGQVGIRVIIPPQGKKDAGDCTLDELADILQKSMKVSQYVYRVICWLHPELDQRLRALGEWLTPVDPLEALPHEMAQILKDEGIEVKVGEMPTPKPQTVSKGVDKMERYRLLEMDIAAVLFSVEKAERVRLVSNLEIELLPPPESVLVPIFGALKQADPLQHLERFGAGDVFYRRIMEAPSYTVDEAERKLKSLGYRYNLFYLEGRLAILESQMGENPTVEAMVEYSELLAALESVKRSRFQYGVVEQEYEYLIE